MKPYFKIITYRFIFCLSLSTTTSCSKKGCTNPKSDNYNPDAKKDDGTCVPWRNKFIGSFSSVDDCTTTGSIYTLTITNSSGDENKIIISDGTRSFEAEVTDESSANIPDQTGNTDDQTYNVSGSINISGNTLIMNYVFSSQGNTLTCLVTGDKL